MMRIGHGFDVHRLQPGDGLVIGGVRIPCAYSFVAHSDGDVAIHALCDALLGAAGLGDIGRHFPDTDARWRNADSRDFLRQVRQLLQAAGWQVGNADLTVIAQQPRLAEHIPGMCTALAADLEVAVTQVNVKATTMEKLGPVGRGEGISAHAVALLLPVTSS